MVYGAEKRMPILRVQVSLFLTIFSCFLIPSSAKAQEFLEDTHLVDIRAGEGLSNSIRQYRHGGYQLAHGDYVSFSDWYSSDWRDLHVTFMTQLSDELGLLWGFGTGEIGEKYKINPSLRLGFVWQNEVARNLRLSISATTVIGGKLREKPCTADYGAIGGVQRVNCRLAASFMAPAETLNYLVDESPADQVLFRLKLVYSF